MALLLLGVCGIGFNLTAAPSTRPVECVLLKGGKMLVVFSGVTNAMEDKVTLPQEITVLTNGVFRLGEGRERPLGEGQVLLADGMLLSPDGSLLPVFDNIMMRRGKPRITQDGQTSALASTYTLGNGAKIMPDGSYITPGGLSTRLLDGQIFKLDGTPVPAQDTMTVVHGQAVIQADGSLLTIPPGRSFMMNDGTKVYGDGTVVMKNGTKKKLAEGEILIIPGVVTKR